MARTSEADSAVRASRTRQILEAAARVLSQQGVRGFTHRAVAAEAGVPLGLTTYYFKDRDELLVAAIRMARESSQNANAELIRALVLEGGIAHGLAEFIEEWTTRQFEQLTMNYRVYVSALYQPSLQPEVATWHPKSDLLEYVDGETAAMLGFLVEGFLIHAVINGRSFAAAEVLPALQRLLDGAVVIQSGGS